MLRLLQWSLMLAGWAAQGRFLRGPTCPASPDCAKPCLQNFRMHRSPEPEELTTIIDSLDDMRSCQTSTPCPSQGGDRAPCRRHVPRDW